MGWKSWLRQGWTLALVVVIVSPFLFFSSSLQPWQGGPSWAALGQEIVYPLEFLWRGITSVLRDGVNRYLFLQHAAEENVQLKRQLSGLQARVMDYEHQVQEASRLRELLGLARSYQKDLIVSEVISQRGSPFRILRVNQGGQVKVRVGAAVVSGQGVVGRVLRVGFKFSDVLLISDVNFHLDVMVERTRVRGILSGDGQAMCHLSLHQRSDLKIGDTVVTSGVLGGFPKGLPVGQVTRISYESDNISQQVIVRPWTDPERLEEVMLLKQPNEEVDDIMSIAGEAWIEETPFRLSDVNSSGAKKGNSGEAPL